MSLTSSRAYEQLLILLKKPSVTPDDQGCQAYIKTLLPTFNHWDLSHRETTNTLYYHGELRSDTPHLCFVGHTDVVPPGNLEDWDSPPFDPTQKDGALFARGSCDMKSAIVAFIDAANRFLAQYPNPPGTLSLLLTSDEEGHATDGIQKALATLQAQHITFDCALVGEPSCTQKTGDTLKVGRRGSLSAEVVVIGKPGHVAYPDQVDNPIAGLSQLLHALNQTVWDNGITPFPPTSFQITRCHSDDCASNMVPKQAFARLNWRFSPACSAQEIQDRAEAMAKDFNLTVQWTWRCHAHPFYAPDKRLCTALEKAIYEETGEKPIHSVSGGTSDGRFCAQYDIPVVEFGLPNTTIHQPNEHIQLEDFDALCRIYERMLKHYFLV